MIDLIEEVRRDLDSIGGAFQEGGG